MKTPAKKKKLILISFLPYFAGACVPKQHVCYRAVQFVVLNARRKLTFSNHFQSLSSNCVNYVIEQNVKVSFK